MSQKIAPLDLAVMAYELKQIQYRIASLKFGDPEAEKLYDQYRHLRSDYVKALKRA